MPLSVKKLAELLALSPDQLRGALGELRAVVFVPPQDEEGELRTLHITFVDFLYIRAPENIRINKAFGNSTLASACLRRMAANDLCFNISGSKSSHLPNPSTMPPWIARSLRYACMQWAHHVELASKNFDNQIDSREPADQTDSKDFDYKIDSFIRCKFPFWLEAPSVFGETGLASQLLGIVAPMVCCRQKFLIETLISVQASRSALLDLLRDAISFVTSFHEAIEFNAAHIYISAIPFAPEDSLISQIFALLLKGLVIVEISGSDSHASGEVYATAMSRGGSAVVVAGRDVSSQVWDEKANVEVHSIIFDHVDNVQAVFISSDGHIIATGSSDYTVRLSNASKGQQLILSGHSGRITAVAFAPDDLQLVSGSGDKTVRIWEVETGQQLAVVATISFVSSITYSLLRLDTPPDTLRSSLLLQALPCPAAPFGIGGV